MDANPQGKARNRKVRRLFLLLFVWAVTITALSFGALAQESQESKNSKTNTQVKKKTSLSSAKTTSRAQTSGAKAASKASSQSGTSAAPRCPIQKKEPGADKTSSFLEKPQCKTKGKNQGFSPGAL